MGQQEVKMRFPEVNHTLCQHIPNIIIQDARHCQISIM